MYSCPHCGNLKYLPFHCHSRFCPSCGTKYAMARTLKMASKLVYTQHRHCVFTINEILCPFFLEDRNLLNCLFRAVNSVILHMFHKIIHELHSWFHRSFWSCISIINGFLLKNFISGLYPKPVGSALLHNSSPKQFPLSVIQ